ncbi:hypothetical protein EYV94_14240 [Puteibacter caeruleilacunae]|nr:hypothetical protein EYV94_14240 [Puteibacter caeruleilacunae]
MESGIIFGIALIALGAFASGSFTIPFLKVKRWEWETYWMIFSVGAYIIFPLLSCFIFSSEFLYVFKAIPLKSLLWIFLLGMIYGVGNLSFGLSLRYLGLSLGYALSLGLMLAIGTLIPPLVDGRLTQIFETSQGSKLIIGVVVACVGIALVGYTGYLKDKKLQNNESQPEFNYTKGVLAALLVGVTGSAMSLGIEQGVPISEAMIDQGTNPLFAINPVLLVLLLGTMVTTIFWCLFQGKRNGSLNNYFKSESSATLAKNYLLCIIAGGIWFVQFFLYGMGKSQMGYFAFIAWGILMALTIAFASVWGLIRKEWKGANARLYILLATSLVIIVVSAFIIGASAA